uniref:Protein ECT2 (inferred by orthology to a human protein) n=1 Tax=Strongyloides venezuelensis TaxID=75913 RepID=A0A0K0F9Y4_STRVS
MLNCQMYSLRADNFDSVSQYSLYQDNASQIGDDESTIAFGGSGSDQHHTGPVDICVVGHISPSDENLQLLENHFNCRLFFSERGLEYRDKSDIIFYMNDFTTTEFNYFYADGKRIMGPGVVKYHIRTNTQISYPKPNRPKYGYTLHKLRICVKTLNKGETRQAVDYVHFMGGSAKRSYAINDILITKAARGTDYRLAISVGGTIVAPSWLKACWAERDNLSFDPLNKDFLNEHSVPCFAGLRIFLYGFKEEDTQAMIKKIEQYEGSVAESYNEATHAVFIDNKVNFSTLPFMEDGAYNSDIAHVTAEWFWTSISVKCCAHEEAYSAIHRPLTQGIISMSNRKRVAPTATKLSLSEAKKNVSKSSLDGTFNNSSSSVLSDKMFSEEDLTNPIPAPAKHDKRFLVCKELLETEENYCKCLETMEVEFKKALEDQIACGNELISKSEISQIFSKVHAILLVHSAILSKLRAYIYHWKSDHLIGKIWADASRDLQKAYCPYINSYDTASDVLKQCIANNEKFQVFLKCVESRPEMKRNTLKDLLIRPVQRLPSVILLLKQILAKTERGNPDIPFLEQALIMMDNVVSASNESRRVTEGFTKTLEICNEIEGLPPDVIASSRLFHSSLECQLVGAFGNFWHKYKKQTIKFFLFNDIFISAKVRSHCQPQNLNNSFATGSTLSRQFSFASLKKPSTKPYRFINFLLFPKIREVLHYSDDQCSGIYILKMRLQLSDEFIVLKPVNDTVPHTNPLSFFNQVCQLITQSSREMRVEEITPHDLDQLYQCNPDETTIIRKAIHHVSAAAAVGNQSSKRHSNIRRALSNVSFNLQTSLQRFSSKATLSTIH